MSMAKILVVDDDSGIRDAVRLLLEEKGYTVKTCDEEDTFFPIVEQFQPDLILLDINLSGTDGRDLCWVLKNNPKTQNIPVVMVSAYVSALPSTKEVGADDFLEKPFEIYQLFGKVRQYTLIQAL